MILHAHALETLASTTSRHTPSHLLSHSSLPYPRLFQISEPHTIALQQSEDVFGRDMKSIDCHNLE